MLDNKPWTSATRSRIRDRSRDVDDLNVAIRGCEPDEIVRISGQHDAATGLDRCGDDMRVHEEFRPGTRRGQYTAYQSSERTVRISYQQPGLTRQAGIE